ncbi:hypothetical protein [Bradyrhizobium uaiense]|uniref:Uncharacterized protein n=1 Tax=Bradyrhizobium uaiense TaxID=2594946 RepID=A0A6P1BDI4_9BRAD|nr:hypothetical protein [Bradyrhizobium uaiense]NEU95670.1 hypothetical protein [Bradyrhizobium uaiense]
MPRLTIDRTMATENIRLRDPDAYQLLEYLKWQHAGAFDLADDVRREMPDQWSLTRFAGVRQRLCEAGFLVVVDRPRSKVTTTQR